MLAKALQERPGISFEIVGGVDTAPDREAMRREIYERKLKTAKMTELLQTGQMVPSADALTIAPAERNQLIDKAYDAEKFVKPKNAIGFPRKLTPPEMEKLMLDDIWVEDQDLRALALRRAAVVQAALGKAAPDAAVRLFVVSPHPGASGRHVYLKLKN